MRLTFFMLADLRTGRGTENVLFNLLKYKPSDVDITIVEPDNVESDRISSEEVKKLTSKCKIIRIHRQRYNINMDTLFKRAYVNLILRPYYKNLKDTKLKGLLPDIQNTDIVYLFLNEYSIFFKGVNIPIIGSGHTLDIPHFLDEHSIFHRLSSIIIHYMYFKNINGFNYFPKDSKVFNKLKDKWHLKYNFPLPPGVDTELFYPDSHEPGSKIKILFVAALEYSKGLDLLIPIMEKFHGNDEIEFHIAGKGSLENKISKIKYVNYHSGLDNQALAELYRSCDVFIYPSHSDAYPAVVSQAFSSGLYILMGNFFKGIFDNFNKYLEYLPMNVDAFYNRINDIIKDRTIIDHNKQEEYAYVKNNYDWSIVAKKFYTNMQNIYDEFYQNRKVEDRPKD